MAALALSACFIDAGSFAGKECQTNVDCPPPWVCAQVGRRPSQPGFRSCELLRGPDAAPPSSGGPADYCHDAKPLLDKTCVANCHGADTSGSSQTAFRLDAYAFDGGFPQGAGDKALRIKLRVADDSMPPVGFTPRLTTAERDLLVHWADLGAPECLDGGT